MSPRGLLDVALRAVEVELHGTSLESFRMRFGSLELDIVDGGRFRLDGGAMFGVVPKALWERQFPADDENRVWLAVELPARPGSRLRGPDRDRPRRQMDAKERELYAIEQGHDPRRASSRRGASASRTSTRSSSPTSTSTTRAAPRGREAGRCASGLPERTALRPGGGARARARPERARPGLVPSGELGALRGGGPARGRRRRDARSGPGLTVVPLPGHNAGMQAVRIESAGRTAFYFADALPTSAHVPDPVDHGLRPLPRRAASRTRSGCSTGRVREEWLCVFEHDPDVPWGTIVDELERQAPRARRPDRPRRVLSPCYGPSGRGHEDAPGRAGRRVFLERAAVHESRKRGRAAARRPGTRRSGSPRRRASASAAARTSALRRAAGPTARSTAIDQEYPVVGFEGSLTAMSVALAEVDARAVVGLLEQKRASRDRVLHDDGTRNRARGRRAWGPEASRQTRPRLGGARGHGLESERTGSRDRAPPRPRASRSTAASPNATAHAQPSARDVSRTRSVVAGREIDRVRRRRGSPITTSARRPAGRRRRRGDGREEPAGAGRRRIRPPAAPS